MRTCIRKAFTLVELLVVISIIALLLSIMMPSLSMVREQGRKVVCASNMRQLSLATFCYIDNTDYLPVYGVYTGSGTPQCFASTDPIQGGYGAPDVKDWKDSFGTPGSALMKSGMLEDTKCFIEACPTSKTKIKISYGYNYANLGSSSTPSGTLMNGKEWVKITKVQKPAETGMYADGHNLPGIAQQPSDNKQNIGVWGIYYWEYTYWPNCEEYSSTGSKYASLGHKNGTLINVGFVDGHMESVKSEELHRMPDSRNYWDVYIWKRIKGSRKGQ